MWSKTANRKHPNAHLFPKFPNTAFKICLTFNRNMTFQGILFFLFPISFVLFGFDEFSWLTAGWEPESGAKWLWEFDLGLLAYYCAQRQEVEAWPQYGNMSISDVNGAIYQIAAAEQIWLTCRFPFLSVSPPHRWNGNNNKILHQNTGSKTKVQKFLICLRVNNFGSVTLLHFSSATSR